MAELIKNATTTPASSGSETSTALTTSVKSNSLVTPNYRLPSNVTLQNSIKLSIVEDKPIMMDYWTTSLSKTSVIGVRTESNEKMLVKSGEEYTSPIVKLYKSENDFIIITENSIYLVSAEIPTRKIM